VKKLREGWGSEPASPRGVRTNAARWANCCLFFGRPSLLIGRGFDSRRPSLLIGGTIVRKGERNRQTQQANGVNSATQARVE
jgi:hypothetical protein